MRREYDTIELEEELSGFVDDTTIRDIPDETLEFTKQLALKTTAGMICGRWQPPSRKVMRYVTRDEPCEAGAGIVFGGVKTRVEDAILANSVFAHASELEDDRTRPNQDVSWDITTFPLVFPLAQKLGRTGREVLEASVIGLEVLTRLIQVPNRQLTPDLIVQPAAMASATAAGKLLGLDQDEIKNALGLAIGGGFVFMPNTGTDAHYFDSAFQCLRGYHAAKFAQNGVTGNPEFSVVCEQFYRSDRDPAIVTEDLGAEWLLREIEVKKYPCCFATHRHIDALRELLDDGTVTAADIESIHVTADEVAVELCDRPDPQTADDLKFSYHHLLGAVLLEGDVNFPQLADDLVNDPEYEAVRKKITVESDGSGRRERPAKLLITTNGGEEIEVEQEHLIGGPHHPLSEQEHRALFQKFTGEFLPDPVIETITDVILELEEVQGFPGVMEELTFAASTWEQ